MPRGSSSSSNGGATCTAGEFVPEVALEYPDALRALHVDYQRAGSDVVEAFTYNGHREKMRVIGKEDLLEPLNRAALQIAREVADARPGDLMAGNISNTQHLGPRRSAAPGRGPGHVPRRWWAGPSRAAPI